MRRHAINFLFLGALAIYGYISWPRLQFLMMGDYKFFEAPLTMPATLLTGALLYSLCALGSLILLTIRWYPHLSGDKDTSLLCLEHALTDSAVPLTPK